MTNDPLRRRPPEPTLRWAARSVGPGSRIVSLRRFTDGGWHANHALTVVDRDGKAHRLVLRRWARPEWIMEDPDFTAEREATVLEVISDTPVPAPELVAADPDGEVCDVPTLLITRLPGRPPGLPRDMDAFLGQLARTMTAIHAASEHLRGRVPGYRSYYYHQRSPAASRWSRRPRLWERALELARADPPPGPRCFIHRDYHPENTLWSRGRLTGVVDWTSAAWGARRGRYRPHALEPRSHLRPRRRRRVPPTSPVAQPRRFRRSALLGPRHRSRPRLRPRPLRLAKLRPPKTRTLRAKRARPSSVRCTGSSS